ncbi:MAG: pyruvate kinase [Candidatus Bathyarchaeia archaeon]
MSGKHIVHNLDAIVQEADGVMVARGDLGVEMGIDDIPFLQKKIIQKANRAGKPVITATQMLESMVDNAVPTRAEVADVANKRHNRRNRCDYAFRRNSHRKIPCRNSQGNEESSRRNGEDASLPGATGLQTSL